MSKIVRLYRKGSQLRHPLVELGGHVPMQLSLIDEVVPLFLVFMKKPGFLPAASSKRLKKTGGQKMKVDEERRNREARPSKYLAGRNDDVSKGTLGMVQSIQHGCDPITKAFPIHVLGAIIEGEDR